MRLLFGCPKQTSWRWRWRRQWWPGRRGDRRGLTERRLPVSLATRHAGRGKTGRKTTRQRHAHYSSLYYYYDYDVNRAGVRVRGRKGSRRILISHAAVTQRKRVVARTATRQLHDTHLHTHTHKLTHTALHHTRT